MDSAAESLTVDAFLSQLRPGERAELVDGVMRPMTPTSGAHGLVTGTLTGLLARALEAADPEASPHGRVFTEMTPVRLFPDRDGVRCPDVAVVLADRFPTGGLPAAGALMVVPDLVVEVLSPTDTASDVEEKRAEYLAAGVRLVWVVDPRTRAVTVYRPDAPPTRLGPGATLTGEPVLPLLRVPVRRIFDGLAPAG